MPLRDYVTGGSQNRILIGGTGIGLIIATVVGIGYVRPALRVNSPHGVPLFEISGSGAIGVNSDFGDADECLKSGGGSGKHMTFGTCGSGGGSVNTGAILNAANDRFVNVSGDTMTGSLVIQNGTVHSATTTALLNVRGTMSGRSLYVTGTGAVPLLMTNITTGRVGIGTSSPKTKLDVVGTISGSALRLHGDAIVQMTSTTASGVSINGLAGQVSPFVSFRNSSGFAKLQVNSSGYLQSQSGITVVSRPNMGSFGGDFTFQIKRDGSNNFGNGAILRFTDNNTNAYIKWVANSFSQGVMDLEFHNANGLNMSMPNAGGIYMYNPVQNSQDISILKVPASTLYPGGGTWPYQAVFKFDPQTFAGTSPLTVTRAIQLYIRSAPIRGGNMTFSKSTAAQFDTGGSNYRGLIIRGGNSQSGSLMEFTNTGHTILSAFTASGYLALGGQNVKKSLVLEAYGSMSGASLTLSGLRNCDTIDTNAAGLLSCGTDSTGGTGSFGSGNVITIGNQRYVSRQGDTMTGALVIQNGNTHSATTTPLLNVRGTLSGSILYASQTIRSSGSIVLEGMLSGATITGFGLNTDCDGSSNKITWDSSTNRFKCEADQTSAGGGLTYATAEGIFVNQGGDTMTGSLLLSGASLDVKATSGTTVARLIGGDYGGELRMKDYHNADTVSLLSEYAGASFQMSHSSGTNILTASPFGFTLTNSHAVEYLTTDPENGRVGINQIAPKTALEVVGTISGSQLVVSGLSTFNGHAVPGSTNKYDLGTNTVRWRHAYLSGGSLNIGSANSSGSISYTTNGFEGLSFYGKGSSSTPSMFVSSGGLVGIGTTLPKTALSVLGTTSGSIIFGNTSVRSSGSLIVENQSFLSGAVIMYEGTDPATPSSRSLAVFADADDFNRPLLSVKDPDGRAYALQPSFMGNFVAQVGPGSTATTLNSFGEGVTATATLSQPTPTEAAPFATNFATSTTSGNESGFIGFREPYFRGSTNGGNGFTFFARVMPVDITLVRHFIGLTDQTSLVNAMASDDIASHDTVQFQFSTVRGDTNWQFVTKDGTTQNVVNTGVAVTANSVYDLYFHCAPQCTTIYWEIVNKTSNTSTKGSTTSNLPGTTVAMRKFLGVETQTTAAKNLRMQSMYTEFKGSAN